MKESREALAANGRAARQRIVDRFSMDRPPTHGRHFTRLVSREW